MSPAPAAEDTGVYDNPLAGAPTLLVASVGRAEGSRGAAAALACAGSEPDRAALLIDFGGRPPRPTLLASAAAQRLEERIAAHLPECRVAARGQLCQLSVPADVEGLETASAAVGAARDLVAVLHMPQPLLYEAVERSRPRVAGVLLRADLRAQRPLVALAARALRQAGLPVAVLKTRLGWVSERRALFGALPPGAPGGLPASVCRRLLPAEASAGGPGAGVR